LGGSGGVSGSANGGSGGIIALPCKSNGDCDAGEYCRKNSCSDFASGSCVLRPEECPSAAQDVRCGCDGFTYFEPCLAAMNGVNLDGPGVCGETMHHHCETAEDCAPARKGASCVDIEDGCGVGRERECWVLPEVCPAGEPLEYGECGSGNDECVSLCEAGQSGKPYAPSGGCG
jgi:hypothetical protein